MSLNIKNTDVETLVNEIVKITGESKTEAIRKALDERRQRLGLHVNQSHHKTHLLAFLQEEIWPHIPEPLRGTQLSKAEEEAILGYGEDDT